MTRPSLLSHITKSYTHLNIRKTCAKFWNIGLTNAHHPCHCNTARFLWEVTAVRIAVTLLGNGREYHKIYLVGCRYRGRS